jgi:hypothetical protein
MFQTVFALATVVPEIVVNALDANTARWALTDYGSKIQWRSLDELARSNASPAIILIGAIFGVETSVHHMMPRMTRKRSGHAVSAIFLSVLGACFLIQAAARLRIAIAKICASRNNLLSAVTLA